MIIEVGSLLFISGNKHYILLCRIPGFFTDNEFYDFSINTLMINLMIFFIHELKLENWRLITPCKVTVTSTKSSGHLLIYKYKK